MGRSPRLLCSGSGISRGMGRSRLLGREPGKEGGVAALGRREGCGGGAFLGVNGSYACLAFPVDSSRLVEGRGGCLELGAGGGGVTA